MKSLLTLALLLLFIGWTSADTIQVAPDGIYVSKVVNGTLVTTRILSIGPGDTLVVHGGNGPTPPPVPPPDPPGDLVSQIKVITQDTIQNDLEASALLGVIRILRRPNVNLAKAKQAFADAIDVLTDDSSMFPNTKMKTWLARVNAIGPDPYTPEFLSAMDAGVRQVHDLARGTITGDLETGMAAMGARGIPARDWSNLIALLKIILQLFLNSDIFG